MKNWMLVFFNCAKCKMSKITVVCFLEEYQNNWLYNSCSDKTVFDRLYIITIKKKKSRHVFKTTVVPRPTLSLCPQKT